MTDITEAEYKILCARAESLMAVNPTADSQYGRWLKEHMPLIDAYERRHKGPAVAVGRQLARAFGQVAATNDRGS
jgi:hypothetical protein